MKLNIFQVKIDKAAGPFRRALQYALYDWTQDMPWFRRVLTMAGLLAQLAALSLALIAKTKPFMFLAILIYMGGLCLMNGMLTSEFVRKMLLESDQIAAEQIQRTLHPQRVEEFLGYQVEMFYKPLRGVGGDYFDVIALSNERTLLALADVSGKGMPAALLAANIQALVRSISGVMADHPKGLAEQVNKHLCQYTPPERFATAVFALLSRETGELTYVNAGQNPPILSSLDGITFLEPTGIPLGLFRETAFQAQTVTIPATGKLLFYTDGLTDGIGGEAPEERVCEALRNPGPTISNLQALIDPKFNEDDITLLLLIRLSLKDRRI